MMTKKLFAVLTGLLAFSAISCDSEDDGRLTHGRCDWMDAPYCYDANTLISCSSDRHWVEDHCKFSCIEDYDGARCAGKNETPSAPLTCRDIPSTGVCQDNVATVCVNGEVRTKSCGSLTCGKRADGQVDCLSNGGSTPSDRPTNPDKPQQPTGCGNVTNDGVCNGNVLSYCSTAGGKEELISQTCDIKCITVGGYADCYEACPADLTNDGECIEGGFRYCDKDNGVITRYCNANSTCGKKPGNSYYDCI